MAEKQNTSQEKPSKYSGKPMSEEELKEHLKAFTDMDECINNLFKKEKKGRK